MNPKQAKTALPILTAYAEGKTIQWKNPISKNSDWIDIKELALSTFDYNSEQYRIKPEPKTVPLTIEDLYEHFKKGTIFAASETSFKGVIIALSDSNIYFGHGFNYNIIEFRKLYRFEDGSPLVKTIEE